MKKAFQLLLSLGALLLSLKALAGPSDEAIIQALTLETEQALELPRVQGRTQHDSKGRPYRLTPQRIEEVCRGAWDAAPLNPHWGQRLTVAMRLICSAYNESGFVATAKRTINTNHSVDLGTMQINSIHWWAPKGQESTFEHWAKCNGYPSQVRQLYDVETNMRFGAYINELMVTQGKRTFKYASRRDTRAIYQHLRNHLPARLAALGVS